MEVTVAGSRRFTQAKNKSVYDTEVDDFLPVWAQPHRFALLDQRQRGVFTFGLVFSEVRVLASAEGVRWFGRRYGFEWLDGLSAGVRRELALEPSESSVATYLREAHGIGGPNQLIADGWDRWDGRAGEPSEDILESFAAADGVLIRKWASNAFSLVDASLGNWARARERVATGYESAAQRRLKLTRMPHDLRSVNAIDGSHHWARRYDTLHERVALELEDLTVRRPRPRICPLCNRVYIPLRPGQPICGNQIWDASSRRLVRRCTPPSEVKAYDAAEAAIYQRQRKTRWAAMNRVRKTRGQRHPDTEKAIAEWEAWREENPPPRRPGRPPRTTETAKPPFSPAGDY